MNSTEYLLSQLGEEASEISQLTSKANRFGLHDSYEGSNNIDKLQLEINDFIAVLEVLQDKGVLPRNLINQELIENKKVKIRHYMRYSRSKGKLR